MTNKPIPRALKELRGTYKPSRDPDNTPEVVPMTTVQMPDYLRSSARAEEIYHQLAAHASAMRVLSREDDMMLGLCAVAMEEVEICTALIEDSGRIYETPMKGGGCMIRTHPAVTQRADAMRRAQSLLSEFGLSPSARSRVSAHTKNDVNPFAAIDG